MAVTALIKDYIAQRLETASIQLARHATEIEDGYIWSGGELTYEQIALHNRVQEYVSGAVIMAVAGVEGMVNELLADSSCDFARSMPSTTPMSNVDDRAQDRWANLWKQGVPGKGFNALEKCQIALATADLPPLREDQGSTQQFKLLLTLRNRLVHSEPAFTHNGPNIQQSELDPLERKLRGKFTPCQMVPDHYPFIWARCLGAGCAQWAVSTAIGFGNDFYRALGIPIQHEVPSWKGEKGV
jgi:hypothetical protein